MDEIPVETRVALDELVRRILREKLGALGRRYALCRDFAVRYLWAVLNKVDWYKKDLIEAYSLWGVDREVLEIIAKEIEQRYGKK